MKTKYLYIIIIVLCAIMSGLILKIFYDRDSLIKEEVSTSVTEAIISENPHYELQLVKADLETYGHLSKNRINEFLKGIEECYEQYHVPIGLMHAVITIESDYRFEIEHDLVTPSGLNHPVRAVGPSAIIWELWKDTLINNGVAEKRSDLFMPYDAMKCAGVILRYLIKEEASKGYDNIVNRVLIRYYGAYLQSRYDKTIKITSELWVKRMNSYLKQLNKTKGKKNDTRTN